MDGAISIVIVGHASLIEESELMGRTRANVTLDIKFCPRGSYNTSSVDSFCDVIFGG